MKKKGKIKQKKNKLLELNKPIRILAFEREC